MPPGLAPCWFGVAPVGSGVEPVTPPGAVGGLEAWIAVRRRVRIVASSVRVSRESGEKVEGSASGWGVEEEGGGADMVGEGSGTSNGGT